MALGSFADTSETNSSDDFPKSSAAAAAAITAWRLKMSNSLVDFSSHKNGKLVIQFYCMASDISPQALGFLRMHAQAGACAGVCLWPCRSWHVVSHDICGLTMLNDSTTPTSLFDKDFPFRILFQESWLRFYCKFTFDLKNLLSMQSLNEPSTSGRRNPFRSVKSSMVCKLIVTWDNQPLEHGRSASIDNISLARLVHLHQAQKQCVIHISKRVWREGNVLCFAWKNHPCLTCPQNILCHSLRHLRSAWTHRVFVEVVMFCACFWFFFSM